MPFSAVSHPRFSLFCGVLWGEEEEVSDDSTIAFFDSISPTLMLRCFTCLELFLRISGRSTEFSDSSLAAWSVEEWIGGSGFVAFEILP
jgi:hypothetical protein